MDMMVANGYQDGDSRQATNRDWYTGRPMTTNQPRELEEGKDLANNLLAKSTWT
jgi:hypothetical protein